MRESGFMRRTTLAVACLYLFTFAAAPAANAEMMGTRTMLDRAERADQVEHVRDLMSQQRVETQMVALGVDPDHAKARVAELTNAELARLEGQLASLPAGGDALGLIGAVFVVLLVLELVGVTDIFTRL